MDEKNIRRRFSGFLMEHFNLPRLTKFPCLFSIKEAKTVQLIHVEIVQTGPDAEFRFWKCQMTRMNSLVQELNRPDIKNVISVLEQANSSIIPVSDIN